VIINSIGDMGFKKTISIIFISFIAIWSLLYLGSVFFVRVLKWIWCGRTITETEKSSIQNDQELEQRTKNSIEYHDEKEQARLFQLDLQDEPIDSTNKKGRQESKLSQQVE
jgi:biopolymer transport protein ExbB/TolQ